MELTAIIKALEYLDSIDNKTTAIIHVDSSYCVNAITKWLDGWRRNNWVKADKKPVLNKELWQKFVKVSEATKYAFEIKKVKGHTGKDDGNAKADELANKGVEYVKKRTIVYSKN